MFRLCVVTLEPMRSKHHYPIDLRSQKHSRNFTIIEERRPHIKLVP